MKTYYVIVGLIGFAVAIYIDNTNPLPPWWVSFLLGYTPGTLIGAAIALYIKERHP